MQKVFTMGIFLLMLIQPAVFAADATTQQLSKTVADLKRLLEEQGDRIDELERRLSTSAPISKSVQDKGTQQEGTWRSGSAWDRLKSGMSESQVVSVLGQPTSSETLGSFRTLYYRGEVEGSGFVSGNVKFSDDRMFLANIPVF